MSFCSFSEAGGITWHGDMLIEILLRLPTKCLIRYKLVCRNWLSLIDAPHFSRLHTLRHPRPEPSLILHTRTSPFFYTHPFCCSEKLIPYHFNFTDPKILSSCNGLLLLHSARDYYVYNPTTKQSRKVVLTENDKYTVVMGLNLAFDPSKSLHYKIVCVRASNRSSSGRVSCYRTEVYDSESRTWKLGSEPFTPPRKTKFSRGVYWNNAINWGYNMYYDIDKIALENFLTLKSHGLRVVEVQLAIAMSKNQMQALPLYSSLRPRRYRFSDKSCGELIDLKNALFYKEDAVQFEPEYVHQFGESFAPV